ncbi:hypothetical protein TYRP_014729 [Tyrophagus putrescentiae]|nr:hypothetical protein TYRP_014729 [Tyrophagus putrescentiae]
MNSILFLFFVLVLTFLTLMAFAPVAPVVMVQAQGNTIDTGMVSVYG